jgi:hypothetical protein
MRAFFNSSTPGPESIRTNYMNLFCITKNAELLTFSVVEVFVCVLAFELETLNRGCDMFVVLKIGCSYVHQIDVQVQPNVSLLSAAFLLFLPFQLEENLSVKPMVSGLLAGV